MMKKHKMVGYFIPDQTSKFFDSSQFSTLLKYVQKHPKTCALKEIQTRSGLRLLLTFNKVCSVQEGLQFLHQIMA